MTMPTHELVPAAELAHRRDTAQSPDSVLVDRETLSRIATDLESELDAVTATGSVAGLIDRACALASELRALTEGA